MFKSKQLKSEIECLKAYILELEEQFANYKLSTNKTIDKLNKTVKELSSDEYYEWKTMALANKDSALKQGHFYLNSRTDIQLLEQIISEINNDPDLAALLTTSDGTTLSLRVHPQPRMSTGIKPFTGEGE